MSGSARRTNYRQPVIVRTIGDRAIVTVIDAARLLPELDETRVC